MPFFGAMGKKLYRIITANFGEWYVIATNSTDAELRVHDAIKAAYPSSVIGVSETRAVKIEPLAYEHTPNNHERLLP